MQILFDENIPESLADHLESHECSSVGSLGWKGISNGVLLRKAEEAGHDALITFDKNLVYQNDLKGQGIAIYVLRLRGHGAKALGEALPQLLKALSEHQPGRVFLIKQSES
ncbi:MAG: DUF5615 family PIN-like protein [Armatimonadetes bacterium]|nr:DUF5615 family PIN-like protein [Armatimonadota bacterium]